MRPRLLAHTTRLCKDEPLLRCIIVGDLRSCDADISDLVSFVLSADVSCDVSCDSSHFELYVSCDHF